MARFLGTLCALFVAARRVSFCNNMHSLGGPCSDIHLGHYKKNIKGTLARNFTPYFFRPITNLTFF